MRQAAPPRPIAPSPDAQTLPDRAVPGARRVAPDQRSGPTAPAVSATPNLPTMPAPERTAPGTSQTPLTVRERPMETPQVVRERPTETPQVVRERTTETPQITRERPTDTRPRTYGRTTPATGGQAMPERRPPASAVPAPARSAPGAQTRPRNWVLDSRHGHSHFYPSVGYSVASLPPAHVSVAYSGSRYYFHYGSWYRPGPVGYVVVRPPLGIIVPVLPPFFTTVWFGSTLYYYANDIYYVPVAGGYAVAEPPPGQVVVPAQAAPATGPDAAGPYPEGTWYYCEASGSFYPYVTECADGWEPVPAIPPELRDSMASVPSYPQGTWFYCDAERGYYPYVAACPQGWRPVPATSQP